VSHRFKLWYFNRIYTPVYDFGIAQSAPYQRLQNCCLSKLNFQNVVRVLCIGVGTGNEIVRILEKEKDVSITGIDTSRKALDRAHRKASKLGKKIDAVEMDAHKLEFADETFDKVLCLHVMGFLEDDAKATREIVRVLKKGGQCVATYPSGIGSTKLGREMAYSIWQDLKSIRILSAVKRCTALIVGGVAYAPISSWVKPSQGFYSDKSLTAMLDTVGLNEYAIEEDKTYQDYVMWGIK
jgi:ubiquinone/menaquinone biosynthesis C-methylase UbiE